MIFDVSCSVIEFRKKIVVLLMTVALGSSVLVVCSAQLATDETESEESIFDPCQPQAEGGAETGSLFANDPNFSVKSSYSPGSGMYFRAMLAVLFLVALGVAAVYVSRRLLPQIDGSL
jgi:hypothetical protein